MALPVLVLYLPVIQDMAVLYQYYSDSARSPSSTQMGTTKSVVFGRVVMGIRARGIDEGADGVAIFYPAKTWLGSWIHLVIK